MSDGPCVNHGSATGGGYHLRSPVRSGRSLRSIARRAAIVDHQDGEATRPFEVS